MKKSKLSIAVFLTAFMFQQFSLPVFAEDFGGSGLINQVNQWQKQASNAAAAQQTRITQIKQKADTMITSRISDLNSLSARIQSDTRLSSSEKTSLTGDIQSAISGLNSLKTKIDSDTDLQTTINDTKQIVTNYYVYEILEPKIRLLIILNNLQTSISNLQGLVPQLQNLINTFQSQGKDVSQLQSILSDINSQIQTISTTISTDITNIQNVSTTSTNQKTVFTQVRTDVTQVIYKGFAKIRSDFNQMKDLFRQIILGKTSVSIAPSGINTTSPIINSILTVTPTSIITPTLIISPSP